MPIENRNLLAGTRLVANYKKQRYVCTIEAAEGGEGVAYVLEDGSKHKSPSAAGSKVMGGKAVNGWRFWSVEGSVGALENEIDDDLAETHISGPAAERHRQATGAAAEQPQGGKAKAKKLIRRLPGTGLDEGHQRFFCSACQKSFVTTETEPQACPEGHRTDDPELTAPVAEGAS